MVLQGIGVFRGFKNSKLIRSLEDLVCIWYCRRLQYCGTANWGCKRIRTVQWYCYKFVYIRVLEQYSGTVSGLYKIETGDNRNWMHTKSVYVMILSH